ncbi:MAG: hypothetical protein IKP06_07710 [Elusimicrobiaceae bacterium]|nr:hypothetical protein [Elusimicrobiaceae bacterium]
MPTQNDTQYFEYRGVDQFHIARVTQDDKTGYVTETPVYFQPVQEIGKTTDSASEAHYYDNKALIVVNSESADTISITMTVPTLQQLAQLTGKSFDPETGMYVDGERQNDYYAISYRTKGTDGKYRYVSRLKGTFNIPEETVSTENDGTDTTNVQVTFTGVYTNYEFNKGKYVNGAWVKGSAKGIVVDERYNLVDFSTFFNQVQTPDSVQASGSNTFSITNTLTHVNDSNPDTSVNSGAAYLAALTAETGYTMDDVTVTMGGTDITSTAYTAANGVIYIADVTGDIVVTATATENEG